MFHLAALRSRRCATRPRPPAERARLASLALFSEVFALHFLEDSFSSGLHGGMGGPAMMKGTHDEYSIHGSPFALLVRPGLFSARRRAPDASRICGAREARVAALAFPDLTRVVTDPAVRVGSSSRSFRLENADYVWRFDSCRWNESRVQPCLRDHHSGSRGTCGCRSIMPVPGRGARAHAALPRGDRALTRFGAGTDGAAHVGRFFHRAPLERPSERQRASCSLVSASGSEGAIGISSDGLIELGIGRELRFGAGDEPGCEDLRRRGERLLAGACRPGAPSSFTICAPYWLIPGDLVLVAPILLLVDFDAYKRAWAIMSAQRRLARLAADHLVTSIGTFQFVLGRELNVLLFNDDDPVLAFNGGDPNSRATTGVRGQQRQVRRPRASRTRPFRSFSNTLTSALGASRRRRSTSRAARMSAPVKKVSRGVAYSVYLRLIMESRWYVGTRSP